MEQLNKPQNCDECEAKLTALEYENTNLKREIEELKQAVADCGNSGGGGSGNTGDNGNSGGGNSGGETNSHPYSKYLTGKTDNYFEPCLDDEGEKLYLLEGNFTEKVLYSKYNSSNAKRRCRTTFQVAKLFGLEKKDQ